MSSRPGLPSRNYKQLCGKTSVVVFFDMSMTSPYLTQGKVVKRSRGSHCKLERSQVKICPERLGEGKQVRRYQ
jgi:hypothetical protein